MTDVQHVMYDISVCTMSISVKVIEYVCGMYYQMVVALIYSNPSDSSSDFF